MEMRKIFAIFKEYFYAIMPYLLTLILADVLRLAIIGVVSYAQETGPTLPFQCPTKEYVWRFISFLQIMVLVVILVIVIFVLVFNMFGFVSTLAMRIGEFFNERIRFVFELLIVYVFFLHGFDETMIIEDVKKCAVVDTKALFSSGPVFFRLIGWLLTLLGLQY